MERWKKYGDTKYSVSDNGQIRNDDNGLIVKQHIHKKGYPCVHIYRKTMRVHRLVAQCFCEGYKEGYVVNHKDGVKSNNHYSNLEWVTEQENRQHAWETGLMDNQKKMAGQYRIEPVVATNRFTSEQVEFDSIRVASRKLNLDPSSISKCCRGKIKYCGNYVFNYKK